MTQEEKAKAYDEAIQRARQFMETPYLKNSDDVVRYIFPELAESEDERIRKEIATYLRSVISNKGYGDETVESWITWLEKQDEQKPIESMPEFKEGDILYNKDSYNSDSIFIFKGMSDKTNAYLCYARLYDGKDFSVYSKKDWDKGVGVYGGEFYLANHKQKELLFSKMEKSGYKWNTDEKKLKKIEQNLAWSKEDESILFCTISDLKFLKDIISKDPIYAVNIIDTEREINWLESLRPQNRWKPSDEQMDGLLYEVNALDEDSINGQDLKSLYQDLKKLREE